MPRARKNGKAFLMPPRSTEISKTFTSPASLSLARSRAGNSAIHGGHQVAQKLIKIGIPLNTYKDRGFPSLSRRVVAIGGVGWRIGSIAENAVLGHIKAGDSPIIPFKICRLDNGAVFG